MTVSQTQINPPQDWQAFERASATLWSDILEDKGLTRFGRNGQEQYGLDITGYRRGDSAWLVGIQCKCIDQGKELDHETVRKDFAKALRSGFPLREYYVTHTGLNDGKLDRLAIQLTEEQRKSGRNILVRIWGWGTLQDQISQYPDAVDAFDPGWSPYANRFEAKQDETHRLVAQIHERVVSVAAVAGSGHLSAADAAGPSATASDTPLDKEIDRYRRMVDDGRPKQALACLETLWSELDDDTIGRVRFRVRANIGHCQMQLGNDEAAAEELLTAFDYWPGEPKAIANKVLGLLLKGAADEAFGLAKESLASFPDSETLGAYLIQAAAYRTGGDDPLCLVPEPLRGTEQVKFCYIDYLRSRNRTPDWWDLARSAAAEFPDNETLKVNAADAVVDRLSRRTNDGRWLDEPERRELVEASLVLADQYGKALAHDCPTRQDHVAHIINYIISLFTLGDLSTAKQVIGRGLDLLPNERNFLVLAGRVGIETNDESLEALAFSGLANDDGEALLIKCQIAARQGNWPFLRNLSGPEVERIPDTDRSTVRALVTTAVAKAEQPEKAGGTAAALVESTRSAPRACILAAQLARDLALPELEKRAFENAMAGIGPDSHFSSRAMVAHYAMGKDAYGAVIHLLDGHVDTREDSSELRMLATAHAHAIPSRKGGNAFFSSLPACLRSGDYYLPLEGTFRYNEGDLPAAEKSFRAYHAIKPADARAILAVVQTLAREPNRKPAIAEFLAELDLGRIEGSPADRMRIAHALRQSGRSDDAIRLAYDALQKGKNDPHAHLLYAFLIFGIGDAAMLKKSVTVERDSWVELTGPDGEITSFLIEDGPDRPADGVYGLSHRYAQEYLGKSIGDVVIRSLPFGDQEWRVSDIKTRYLHAFRDVTNNFNSRFPGHPGFWKMTVKDDDISPMLDVVRKQAEHRDHVLRTYEKNLIPLHFVASAGGGGDVVSFMETLRLTGGGIKTCLGSGPERIAALESIGANRSKGAVLDTLTFWTIAGLGALDVLKAVFGRVAIARPTVDEIASMKDEYLSGENRQQGTTAFYNGQFYFHEMTAENWRAREKLFAERETALKDVEVATVHYADDADFEAEAIVQEFGPDLLASALVASEQELMLISDDLAYRVLARDSFHVGVSWLQAVFMYAHHSRIIGTARYAALIADLARLKHGFVSVEASSLVALLPNGGVRGSQFDVLTDYLGTKSADMKSHIGVCAAFLRQIWAPPQMRLEVLAVTGILMEKLIRFRNNDWQAVLSIMTDLVGNDRFDEYLRGWRRGHFLPDQDVPVAIKKT
jgi:tetratricopeptide (TPR) repeat protein